MPNVTCCDPSARRADGWRPLMARALAGALLLGLGACATPTAPTVQAAAPPRTALSLEEAVVALAESTLSGARTLPEVAKGGRRALVIDPLIDRASGAETGATRGMVAQIETLVRERHPEFELQPFSVAALEEKP